MHRRTVTGPGAQPHIPDPPIPRPRLRLQNRNTWRRWILYAILTAVWCKAILMAVWCITSPTQAPDNAIPLQAEGDVPVQLPGEVNLPSTTQVPGEVNLPSPTQEVENAIPLQAEDDVPVQLPGEVNLPPTTQVPGEDNLPSTTQVPDEDNLPSPTQEVENAIPLQAEGDVPVQLPGEVNLPPTTQVSDVDNLQTEVGNSIHIESVPLDGSTPLYVFRSLLQQLRNEITNRSHPQVTQFGMMHLSFPIDSDRLELRLLANRASLEAVDDANRDSGEEITIYPMRNNAHGRGDVFSNYMILRPQQHPSERTKKNNPVYNHTEDILLTIIFENMLCWMEGLNRNGPMTVYLYTYLLPCTDCYGIVRNFVEDRQQHNVELILGYTSSDRKDYQQKDGPIRWTATKIKEGLQRLADSNYNFKLVEVEDVDRY